MTKPASSNFSRLGLLPALLQRLNDLNYQQPTPIQAQVIPAVLEGRDVLAGANTGSGKTAAFALPVLQSLHEHDYGDRSNAAFALILVPTRELAQQVADACMSYAAAFSGQLKVTAVYGGVSTNKQMLALRSGCDVLVATPGRLLDLVQQNAISLKRVRHLVLDEADRMLSLGFADELAKVLALLPKRKQSLLFSATYPEEVADLAVGLLHQPLQVELQSAKESTLTQRVITVNKNQKGALLRHLIEQYQWRQVLIFASAKRSCDRLAKKLKQAGIAAEVFHSDKAQATRQRILDGFKQGQTQVLIATDIAARGIDIEKLPVVINFELPRSPADYMHRIGRSGRAGESGLAMSLISHDEYHHFKVIEKKNKVRLKREQIAGFEADDEAPEDCPSRQEKPQAKPAGTGKKHRKKAQAAVTEDDIWDFWRNKKS
ncbi:DEAD/DEAH box helicase [Motilimonas pumila]|uniref:DEAD/DEAH box helicase n=1 Tax=Motilimonas pumila TaxID=2303987 RepID=A0A418YDP9_9GAMM|nr:DEAD/DEAH box helicase [Motilimonas pumila]RJG42634.1 DEAD/DEAH box helicase [Motilimonas pumila]